MFTNPITRYIMGGMGIALLLALAWGFRVDHLRAGHKENIDAVVKELKDAGYTKTNGDFASVSVKALADSRDKARAERDTARQLVDIQSASIEELERKSEEAAREAAAQRRLIDATVRERNAWIARARAAETRTERLSAEQEVAECEAVLNSLYSSGF